MAQLTGNFQGTAAADTFSGSIARGEQTVENGVATGIAVKQVIIDTFGGNDIITASTDFAAIPVLPTNAIGMTNADISTGVGVDTVNIVSTGRSLVQATSTGLQNALIETNEDNDAITVRASSFGGTLRGNTPYAITTGVRLATLSAGSGNDSIVIDTTAAGDTPEGRSLSANTGIDQSTLLGGDGSDSITITSKNEGFGEQGATVSSTGANGSSRIQGDAGNDNISISAITTGGRGIGQASQATATGSSSGTFVEGGDGSDTITLLGSATAGGAAATPSGNEGGIAQAYGAVDSFVFGGAGRDTISITGTSKSGINSSSAFSYGVSNTTVDGGNGDDSITIKALGSTTESGATHHGAVNSNIYGGIGSDTIDISASEANNVKASVGVLGSTLNAGEGADSIKVRGLKFDIQDSLIQGGNGNDTFDTGIGTSNVLGGSGTDLFKLDFFNADTMTIEQQGADGIKITGTLDKTGSAASWTQNVFEVESYEVAGTVYDAAGVVSLLG
jgi:hypothetical protein